MGLETLIGLGTALAGTGLSLDAASSEKNAMNQAYNNEEQQLSNFGKQGQGVFQQSLANSTPQAAQQQMAQGQQNALAQYASTQGQQLPGIGSLTPGRPVGPSNQIDATQNAITQGKIGQQNQAGAALQGYNTYGLQQGLSNLRANTQLGQLGTFAQQSAQNLPIELQQAQQSRQGEAGFGSLLNTLGGLASLYGAVNKPLAGLGGFGSPIIPGTQSLSQAPFQGIGYGGFGPWGQMTNSMLGTLP